MPIVRPEDLAFLQTTRRGVLATIAPNGQPRQVPICFAIVDSRAGVILYSALDEKPKRGSDPHELARVRDLLVRPRVSLLADSWDEDWARLAWLRVEATASLVETTAARNSSVRLLRLEDLDFERALLRFRRGKGGKTLDVALQPETGAALRAYLADGRPFLVEQAGTATEADPGWLFVSACKSEGVQPLSMNALSLMLTRRYHTGGGTLRTFGSHRIRHATATLLVNNGMPLEEVSRYLGHSSTDVTRRYARQTPDALGLRAAEALERSGLVAS